MLALTQVHAWHWIGFVGCVLVLVALDLGVLHRRAPAETYSQALLRTALGFSLAMLFALALKPWRGNKEALEFVTSYLIELSLAMYNFLVIALVFTHFAIPSEHQHRVLAWGILGALAMRGLMIGAGVALVVWLHWVLYLFGAFLVGSGVRLVLVKSKVEPEKNLVVRLARKFLPVVPELDGRRFVTWVHGRRALTRLALALLVVETSDLLFAFDSIPAVFAVTTKPFIVFTSNVFAILGLRSLYFVLAGAMRSFRYLKPGLSLVLVLFGLKMLLDPHDHPPRWFQVRVPIGASLATVAAILLISVVLSVLADRRRADRPTTGP
jgi:tellurite resistance protein TerC